MAAWALKEAESSAKEIFERAFTGEPQIVTRHGVPSLVIITYADYEAVRPTEQKSHERSKRKSFVDFLRNCPADLSELDLTRDKDTGMNREDYVAEG